MRELNYSLCVRLHVCWWKAFLGPFMHASISVLHNSTHSDLSSSALKMYVWLSACVLFYLQPHTDFT